MTDYHDSESCYFPANETNYENYNDFIDWYKMKKHTEICINYVNNTDDDKLNCGTNADAGTEDIRITVCKKSFDHLFEVKAL